MIFGNISNKFLDRQIAVLPAALQGAIRLLKGNDLAAHEPGRFDIELGGIPMILQVLGLNTAPRETLRSKAHRKNMSVQFLAADGPERAGYYNNDRTSQVDGDLLDTSRDILFYHNNPNTLEGTIELVPETCAVYFPWDMHIPAVQTGASSAPIRKIVIKVPMSACALAAKD